MNLGILFISLCALNVYADGRWKNDRYVKHREWNHRFTTNDISTPHRKHLADPPDHNKLVAMARYVLHNSGMFIG